MFSPVCTSYVFPNVYIVCFPLCVRRMLSKCVRRMCCPVCTSYVFPNVYVICFLQAPYVFPNVYVVWFPQCVHRMFSQMFIVKFPKYVRCMCFPQRERRNLQLSISNARHISGICSVHVIICVCGYFTTVLLIETIHNHYTYAEITFELISHLQNKQILNYLLFVMHYCIIILYYLECDDPSLKFVFGAEKYNKLIYFSENCHKFLFCTFDKEILRTVSTADRNNSHQQQSVRMRFVTGWYSTVISNKTFGCIYNRLIISNHQQQNVRMYL